MIIMDLSQIAMANAVMLAKDPRVTFSYSLLRHNILDTIRLNLLKFNGREREVVIAADHPKTWRTVVFPLYKARRAATKSKVLTGIDPAAFRMFMWNFVDELREHFPFITIRVPFAEGDDIIGAIVHKQFEVNPEQEILILSGDKDFKQLHFSDKIRQYSPVRKEFVTSQQGADWELQNLIIRGDMDDGVPSILNPDDHYVTETKGKKLTAKRIEAFRNGEGMEDPEVQKNFHRNTVLIDLKHTPASIKEQVGQQYEDTKRTRGMRTGKMLPYFMSHGMMKHIDLIGEFTCG